MSDVCEFTRATRSRGLGGRMQTREVSRVSDKCTLAFENHREKQKLTHSGWAKLPI